MKFVVCAVVLSSLYTSNAFNAMRSPLSKAARLYSSPDGNSPPDDGNLLNGLKAGFSILTKGMSKGDGFKQSLADAFAGPDLDLQAANARIDEYISKSPVVVFSWSVSVFSKKAKDLLKSIGVTYETVELGKHFFPKIRPNLDRKSVV